MPVDPSISLQAGVQPSGTAVVNPLDTISKFMAIQGQLNQNALFQQTFQAKQAIGQIMATSPDLDTGIQRILQSPYAAFATEAANNMRQMQATMVQIAREKQGMAQGGLEFMLKHLGSALADPSQLGSGIDSGLKLVDPMVRNQVSGSMASIVEGLGHGLPADKAAASNMYSARLAGMLMGSGWTPESIRAVTGTQAPSTVFEPVGPGGATVPVQIGGPAAGPVVGPRIVGDSGLVTPTPSPAGGNALSAAAPAAPPVAPASLRGLGKQEAEYAQQTGKDAAEYTKDLGQRVQIGTNLMQVLTEAQDALHGFRPGGGQTAYSAAAKVAQAFGASNDLVDRINRGDLGASEEFGKLMVQTTMGNIKEALSGIGGSRLNQMEFQTFQKNNPNLDTDPRAIEKIFNFWTRLYNRDVMEQQERNAYLRTPGAAPQEWPEHWQRIMRDRGLVRTSTEAAGSQGGAVNWEVRDGKLMRVPQ